MAKGHDHEYCEGLCTYPKALSWEIEIEFYMVTGIHVLKHPQPRS